MKPTLQSWGSSKFTWREGGTYYRQHDDSTHRGIMVLLFRVEKIKGNYLIGKELISNIPIKIHYKSDPAQEFRAFDSKFKREHFNWIFKDPESAKHLLPLKVWVGRDSGFFA